MKIKLDENIPKQLVLVLKKLGHDVDTVADEKLTGSKDEIIWSRSQKEGRFLITQDLDFSDIRIFKPGTHHGILLVRLHEPGRVALKERVKSVFSAERVENWAKCFVVLTDKKLRVVRPDR